jgi:AsmA protein
VRAARWILGIAAAAVLLAIAAALIAALVVNPDHYKGDLESAVRGATGRPFVLEGHLRLTWFPWLGMRMGAARLGNPPGAGGPDLLDWQSADVRVRLLPLLLHRQLEVGRIRIVGADLHLRRGPDGRGSWDDLIARLGAGGGTAGHPASAATVGGLELVDGSLDYLDEHSGEHVSLTDWRLDVGAWSAGEPLSVSTSFLLHAAVRGADASAAAGGALQLPAAGVHVSLDVPRLQFHASPLEVTAPRWSFAVADAKLAGALEAARDASGRLTASGSLTAAVPSVRQLAGALGIGLPALADPATLGALSLAATWRYRDGALEAAPLTARLDATTLTGRIDWSPPATVAAGGAGSQGPRAAARVPPGSGDWTFALRADQVDFGRYLTRSPARKPLELPVSALRALHAQGTLELARARIDGTTLQDVRLQVR